MVRQTRLHLATGHSHDFLQLGRAGTAESALFARLLIVRLVLTALRPISLLSPQPSHEGLGSSAPAVPVQAGGE
jgi:hypothetical protein